MIIRTMLTATLILLGCNATLFAQKPKHGSQAGRRGASSSSRPTQSYRPNYRATPNYRSTPNYQRSTTQSRTLPGRGGVTNPSRKLAGTFQAKKPATVKAPQFSSAQKVNTARYASTYGVKLKSGYYAYKGLNHRQWTRRFFSPQWKCWCWFDPCTDLWYYYCGSRGYYLPVRYLVVLPPTQTEETSQTDLPPEGEEVSQANQEEAPDLPEPKE